MEQHARTAVLAAVVAVLLLAVAFSILYDGRAEPEKDFSLEGEWHQVGSMAYTDSKRIIQSPDPDFDITISFPLKDDGTPVDGNVFHAVSQGVGFSGFLTGEKVMFEYQTRYGSVFASGGISGGDLVLKEVHYYYALKDSDGKEYKAPYWFVAVNTYSKTPGRIAGDLSVEPDINRSWELWEGTSFASDGDRPLVGYKFMIHEQRGPFFRAEMEQDRDGEVVTRVLNGVIMRDYQGVNGTGVLAYMVDSVGKIWTLALTEDTAVVRVCMLSELADPDVNGHPVVAQRLYRNINVLSHPTDPPGPSIGGTEWTAVRTVDLYGDGHWSDDPERYSVHYTGQRDSMFAGTGSKGDGSGLQSGTEVGFAVTNADYPGGYLLHLGSEYTSDGYGQGFAWIDTAADGSRTMHMFSFWYGYGDPGDGSKMNWISHHVLE